MGVDDITIKFIMTMSDLSTEAQQAKAKRNLWKSLDSKIMVTSATLQRTVLLDAEQVDALCPIWFVVELCVELLRACSCFESF